MHAVRHKKDVKKKKRHTDLPASTWPQITMETCCLPSDMMAVVSLRLTTRGRGEVGRSGRWVVYEMEKR